MAQLPLPTLQASPWRSGANRPAFCSSPSRRPTSYPAATCPRLAEQFHGFPQGYPKAAAEGCVAGGHILFRASRCRYDNYQKPVGSTLVLAVQGCQRTSHSVAISSLARGNSWLRSSYRPDSLHASLVGRQQASSALCKALQILICEGLSCELFRQTEKKLQHRDPINPWICVLISPCQARLWCCGGCLYVQQSDACPGL